MQGGTVKIIIAMLKDNPDNTSPVGEMDEIYYYCRKTCVNYCINIKKPYMQLDYGMLWSSTAPKRLACATCSSVSIELIDT